MFLIEESCLISDDFATSSKLFIYFFRERSLHTHFFAYKVVYDAWAALGHALNHIQVWSGLIKIDAGKIFSPYFGLVGNSFYEQESWIHLKPKLLY